MDKKHKGASSELRACTWLLDQGYEVFRNVSHHGHADLFVISPAGEQSLVDVKTEGVFYHADGTLARRALPKKKFNHIKLLVLHRDVNEFTWVD